MRTSQLRRQIKRLEEQDARADIADLYTPEQIEEIRGRIREYQRRGQPELANALKTKLYSGELVEPAEYTLGPVTSTKPGLTREELEPPAEFGKGSSQKAWAAFGERTSDIDPEVLRQAGRDDIIAMLKEVGVYNPETDDDADDDAGDDDSDNDGD